MNKKILCMLLLLLFGLTFLSGCVTTGTRYVWYSEPDTGIVSKDYYEAKLIPYCGDYGCRSFQLVIKNKKEKDIELNWNKTLYITNGQTSGGFMFEGVVYKERNNPKMPDIIFGNTTLTKRIWPNNLVRFSAGRYGGWVHETMAEGENGIYLSIIIDGKEINEKLTVVLSKEIVQR